MAFGRDDIWLLVYLVIGSLLSGSPMAFVFDGLRSSVVFSSGVFGPVLAVLGLKWCRVSGLDSL